jgi:quinol monooxygenase YgiN
MQFSRPMNLKTLLRTGALALWMSFHSASHAQATNMPFVRLADLRVNPAQLATFKAAAVRHAEATMRDERGALALHAIAEKDRPENIRVLEIYVDDAAYEAHLRTPHFRQFRASTEAITTSRALFDTVPVLLGAKPSLPPNPVVRTADLEIDPAQLDAYKAAVSEEIEASIRVEPGVGAIYAVALKDVPHHIRFIEIYADENAYLRHRETPHFRKYLEVTQRMITGRKLVEATPLVIATQPR